MTSSYYHAVGPAAMLDLQISKEKERTTSQFENGLKVHVLLLPCKTGEETSVAAGKIFHTVVATLNHQSLKTNLGESSDDSPLILVINTHAVLGNAIMPF